MNERTTVPVGDPLTLQKYKFASMAHATPEFAIASKLETSTHEGFMRDELTYRLTQEVFGKQLELVEEAWPADWWQAVKERFAPRWFLARWPVRQKSIRIDVRALFPLLDVPRNEVRFQHIPWVDVRRG